MSHILYRKNDNIVEWQWLKSSTDGQFVNDGTVTFTLYSGYSLVSTTGALTTPAGAVNVTVYGPASMDYVSGSDGKYQGKLPSTVDLDLALEYTIEINATADGHVARRSIPVTVVDRVDMRRVLWA
jgi:hypothetical protein